MLAPEFWPTVGVNVGLIAVYAVIGAVLMYVGYFAIDLTTPGDLRGLVREGRPNAVVVSAAGMVSMALIVVVAIYISGGGFVEGMLNTAIYGLVGIVAQVLAVRGLEAVARLDVDACLHDDRFTADSAVIAAMHVALGLVVAVAII
ncbi:DUF350 domain-containing protein [Actinomycetospora chibensis]|uniref:DUF350 domain-containing protein n=1 Tax=Actinomycetospora chibensis TaxID=663606 RepID=A0ABV9RG47_9PSEU|nr:DUF350 domain-containing protein [Actinomycetospora chibensis]MDD7922554.1 DUF350 domain-containing protein [Actinomycetospora chibensis]